MRSDPMPTADRLFRLERSSAISVRAGQEALAYDEHADLVQALARRPVGWALRMSQADDGARTRDTWLGKPVLYRLSYVRAPRF